MSIESKLAELFNKNPKSTYKPRQLAKLFKIPERKYPAFKLKLKKMGAEGKITRHKKGYFGQGFKTSQVSGIIHVKTQGYGYLISEDQKADIFISQKNLGTALHGDRVRVLLFAWQRGKNPEGRVIDIIQRGRQNIVGIFQHGKNWGLVTPDDMKIHRVIYVAPENQKNARSGEKVVVHLTDWTDERQNPQGKIVEVLGQPDDTGVDIISIARAFDLQESFPKQVNEEANRLPDQIPEAEIQRRLDWRDELTFTIDPVDSKDFDDAVSLKKLDNGNFLLGVHIADVSHYVKQGSKLDEDSQKRATSVYLVDRVIPMLPERISNEICSLKQGVDRVTFSVLIELNNNADIIKYDIRESIINSDRRFTYEEAQNIIDKKSDDKIFADVILQMFELSKKLTKKRQARGSLDFSSQEVRINLNEKLKPVSIEKIEQIGSHRLIEEFMVLANSVVAAHIDKNLKEKTGQILPFPYRVHERPSGEKLNEFRNFLKALGINFQVKKRVTPKMFQSLQHSIKGTNRQSLVDAVMIRSMMKAKYTIKNEGHFGLALKYYSHFTSPIRRYPDLLAHRLLKHYLAEPDKTIIKKQNLEKMCSHATEKEIKAMEAERTSIKAKKIEFMLDKIGETYPAIISGVTAFGIFAEITDYLIEGLIHVTSLTDDYYNFDETRYCLTGTYEGKCYQLGDQVLVKVILVNPDEKIIDFELVNNES